MPPRLAAAIGTATAWAVIVTLSISYLRGVKRPTDALDEIDRYTCTASFPISITDNAYHCEHSSFRRKSTQIYRHSYDYLNVVRSINKQRVSTWRSTGTSAGDGRGAPSKTE